MPSTRTVGEFWTEGTISHFNVHVLCSTRMASCDCVEWQVMRWHHAFIGLLLEYILSYGVGLVGGALHSSSFDMWKSEILIWTCVFHLSVPPYHLFSVLPLSSWYDVDFSIASPLRFGLCLGCDFAENSCFSFGWVGDLWPLTFVRLTLIVLIVCMHVIECMFVYLSLMHPSNYACIFLSLC